LPEPLDFWDLLARVEAELAPQWAGRARLRLSSVEPGQLTARAVEVLGGSRLVAPHLHLSLQSGDAGVLKRMGRGHYRPEQVLDFLGGLRRHWPRLGLGADLLTGFPGETREQFETTFAFCRELPLTYAHVFPFSPRPGTAAAALPDSLPKAERTARAARLRGLAESKKSAFQKELLALPKLTVLVENAATGQGVCEYYTACEVHGGGLRAGALAAMRPEDIRGGRVAGHAAGDEA
jgi:2-methylthioadenine synthetase